MIPQDEVTVTEGQGYTAFCTYCQKDTRWTAGVCRTCLHDYTWDLTPEEMGTPQAGGAKPEELPAHVEVINDGADGRLAIYRCADCRYFSLHRASSPSDHAPTCPHAAPQPAPAAEVAHTPGPWRVNPTERHPWIVECPTTIPGLYAPVCEVSYKPNAPVLAAAPDLLEASQRYLAAKTRPNDDNPSCWAEEELAEELLRAAIAKALTGQEGGAA